MPEERIPNLIEEVLGPAQDSAGFPDTGASTAEVAACVSEVKRALLALAPPNLDTEQRRRFASTVRVEQAAITEIAERVVRRSPRVAAQAALPPQALKDLLLTETALAANLAACWPIIAFALVRVRRSSVALRTALDAIGEIAAQQPTGELRCVLSADAKLALGREAQATAKGNKTRRQKEQLAAQLDEGRRRIAEREQALKLTDGVRAGKQLPRIPREAPAAAPKARKPSTKRTPPKGGKKP